MIREKLLSSKEVYSEIHIIHHETIHKEFGIESSKKGNSVMRRYTWNKIITHHIEWN